eukprot:ANDGO_07293.mRNA.1 hypothetical protein
MLYGNPYGPPPTPLSAPSSAAAYFVANNVGIKVFDTDPTGLALLKGNRQAYRIGIAAKIGSLLAVVAFAILSATVSDYSSLFAYHVNNSEDFNPDVQTFAFGNATIPGLNITYAAYGFQKTNVFMPAACMQALDPKEFAAGKSVSRKALVAFLNAGTNSGWVLPDLALYRDSLRIAFGLIAGTVVEIFLAVLDWKEFKKTQYLIRNKLNAKQILSLLIGIAIPPLLGASLLIIVTNLPMNAFFLQPEKSVTFDNKYCTAKSAIANTTNAHLLEVQQFASIMAGIVAGAFLFLVVNVFVALRQASNIGAWKRDNGFTLSFFDKMCMKFCCCRPIKTKEPGKQ